MQVKLCKRCATEFAFFSISRMKLPDHALRLRLDLQKTRLVSNVLRKACARSLFLHLLYSRGVLPCPAEQLLLDTPTSETTLDHEATTTTTSSGNTTTVTKKRKLHVIKAERVMRKNSLKVQQVLHDFDSIFTMTSSGTEDSVKAVLFTLGPSFTSPREQYLIRFIPHHSQDNDVAAQEPFGYENSLKVEKEISRRTIRLFLQGTCLSLDDESNNNNKGDKPKKKENVDIFELSRKLCKKSLSSRKMNVAFYVSVTACKDMFQYTAPLNHTIVHDDDAGNLDSTLVCRPNPTGFQVRHKFDVKTAQMISKKKGIHRPFVIMDIVPAFSSSAHDLDLGDGDLGQGQWITLTKSIKGFRL
jgi:hypothetical protein